MRQQNLELAYKDRPRMKRKQFLVLLLLSSSFLAAAQQERREETVTKFINLVFNEETDVKFIFEELMSFQPTDQITREERLDILEKHLEKIRKQKAANMKDFLFVPYDGYRGEKIPFSQHTDNIGILLVDNEPEMYFYFKGNKIFSFDYFTKSENDAFFIVY